MTRSGSPLAAAGVVLVLLSLGAFASRHEAARPSTSSVRIAEAPAAAPGPVELNAADAAALESLPRIGPALARRIVESRDALGPFRTVDDLLRVRGIGPATLDRIRPLVRVESQLAAP